MSGWIYTAVFLAIVSGILFCAWRAERHQEKAWWRPSETDYIDLTPHQIGRRRWR